LPLTRQGERNAATFRDRLAALVFEQVLTSPLQRARQTCELAGFGAAAEVDPDLVEWDYGEYEGLRTVEIRATRPDWELFRDGCPNGESPAEITARADRVISRLRNVKGNVLIFSSGHFLRALAARWLSVDALFGKYLVLDTASLSTLSYEHDRCDPAIRCWNDTRSAVLGG
jgi:probable phosphoglycerate mutase